MCVGVWLVCTCECVYVGMWVGGPVWVGGHVGGWTCVGGRAGGLAHMHALSIMPSSSLSLFCSD